MSNQDFSDQLNCGGCCGGGCFSGDSLVKMANGTQKLIKDILKYDMIATPTGVAQVRCLLQFNKENS